MERTTIIIKNEPKKNLERLKSRNKSFDSIIQRLIRQNSHYTDKIYNHILHYDEFIPLEEL